MDARRASDALKARAEKTDKADARALAEMLASGWYSAVHGEEPGEPSTESAIGVRDQLVRAGCQLYGQVRWLAAVLRESRYLSEPAPSLSMRLCEWPATRRTYFISRSGALLGHHACERGRSQIAVLDKQVRTLTQKRKACWHLMTVPGVGPITALALSHGGDRRSASFLSEPGCWGLSGPDAQALSIGRTRHIAVDLPARRRDGAPLSLQRPPIALLTTVTGASALKSWGLKMVKRCGAKRARTAVARKLAVLLLRLWKQESHFEAQSA